MGKSHRVTLGTPIHAYRGHAGIETWHITYDTTIPYNTLRYYKKRAHQSKTKKKLRASLDDEKKHNIKKKKGGGGRQKISKKKRRFAGYSVSFRQ